MLITQNTGSAMDVYELAAADFDDCCYFSLFIL